MTDSPEVWVEVVGFPNYSVSSCGSVMRTGHSGRFAPTGRPLASKPNKHGYINVSLYRDGKHTSKGLHVVVCEAFHGPCPSLDHEVAHGDGFRSNNRSDNLRWAMPIENMADCLIHGTRHFGDAHHSRKHPERLARGERNGGGRKLSESDIPLIRADTRKHQKIADQYGVVKSMIAMIKRRETWKHVT